MMWWYHDPGPVGWLATFAFLGLSVVVIVAVAWTIIRLTGQSRASRSDRALEILRERFGRGEISQAEFQDAKRVLGLE